MKIEIWPHGYQLKNFARIKLALPDCEFVNHRGDIMLNCSVYSSYRKKKFKRPTLNADFNDDRKSFVDRVWSEIAGYSITVDPSKTVHPYVEKSDCLNGAHDGMICVDNKNPIKGKVYQRFIDTLDYEGTGCFRDIRVCVFGYEAKFAFQKLKTQVFITDKQELEIQSMDEFFYPDEIALINEFAKAVNLEYGEIDVLRGQDDMIYCIDITCTPGGHYTRYMLNRDLFFKPIREELIKLIEWKLS